MKETEEPAAKPVEDGTEVVIGKVTLLLKWNGRVQYRVGKAKILDSMGGDVLSQTMAVIDMAAAMNQHPVTRELNGEDIYEALDELGEAEKGDKVKELVAAVNATWKGASDMGKPDEGT